MKNKSHKKKKSGSFFSLLVKNYIVFTVAVLLVAAAILYGFIYMEHKFLGVSNIEKIKGKTEVLEKEHYEQIKSNQLLGNGGFFEVVDSNGKILYASDKGKSHILYTRSEVNSIGDYFSNQYWYIAEYQKAGDAGRILMELSSYEEESENSMELGYVILDGDLNILEDTVHLNKKKFTPIEYQYIQNIDGRNKGYGIYKYSFQTKDGNSRTLIMHIKEISQEKYAKISRMYQLQIPVFIPCYIILIVFFIIWMNRKVKQPLEILNKAMIEFSSGKRNEKLSYTGSNEFEQICESFNLMSDQLLESEKNKQQLMEEKQKILADISHDLKTPITVIQGYAKAINDGIIPEEEKVKYLNIIYHKANGLAELIQVFYDYSRLEHPDFAIQKEEKDLCEYIREYLAIKYEEIQNAGFFLEADIEVETVMYRFDQIHLKRVFENLIGNALKHNKKGTTILFGMKIKANQIEITIGDDGIGIPEGIKDTLFEAFVVGDESRNNRQGSGLGLAIAKKIMEAHGGNIFLAKSQEYQMKTEIKLILPM